MKKVFSDEDLVKNLSLYYLNRHLKKSRSSAIIGKSTTPNFTIEKSIKRKQKSFC
ncbi:hypothetical protein LDL59_07430 [Kaistella anthropi]|nr:hypothetical protein [Kaistella anthropi]